MPPIRDAATSRPDPPTNPSVVDLPPPADHRLSGLRPNRARFAAVEQPDPLAQRLRDKAGACQPANRQLTVPSRRHSRADHDQIHNERLFDVVGAVDDGQNRLVAPSAASLGARVNSKLPCPPPLDRGSRRQPVRCRRSRCAGYQRRSRQRGR